MENGGWSVSPAQASESDENCKLLSKVATRFTRQATPPPTPNLDWKMDLDVSVKSGQRPLAGASLTLSTGLSRLRTNGPIAHFVGLKPDLYNLKVEAHGHRSQSLTLALRASERLDIELKERK